MVVEDGLGLGVYTPFTVSACADKEKKPVAKAGSAMEMAREMAARRLLGRQGVDLLMGVPLKLFL